MAMVFGILGFVMGLTALWFTAEAVRRVDKNGEGLIRPHLRQIRSKIAETNTRISHLEARLEKTETRMLSMFLEERKARDLAARTGAIRQGLADVRQDFRPTSTYNA